jgi:hypothetical protein
VIDVQNHGMGILRFQTRKCYSAKVEVNT